MSSAKQTIKIKELLNMGFDALSKGQVKTAGEIAHSVLQADNQIPAAHFLTGLVAVNSRRPDIAMNAFQSVVGLDKNHAAGWAQLAHQYMKFGMVNQAENAIQQIRRLRSDDPLVLDAMGTTLSLMGEHTLANTCFARAHTLQPENTVYMHNLANNLIYGGENKEAEILFNRIIELNEDTPQSHWALSTVKKATSHDHINKLKSLAEKNKNDAEAESFYYYAMGKEHEDLQEWPEAFSAFEKGAKAKQKILPFDEKSQIEGFEYLKKHFTREWLEDGAKGHLDTSPIFVLGQPRTGTTLIERIITAHSQVHSAGELQQLRVAVVRLGEVHTDQLMGIDTFKAAQHVDPENLGKAYIHTSGRMRGTTPRFVDKLPQNYMLLPLILKALPNAKIIHLVRDPMDACFASYKQLFAEAYAHSYDQENMAKHHLRYLDLMSCWRERFGDRFLDISYEETARDLEPNARKLIDFLDLPWEDQCLEFHKQDTAVSTASAVQVREPAHTRSIGRWRRYEQQLEPMLTTLLEGGARLFD